MSAVSPLPPIGKGEDRAYRRCTAHGNVGWYDYVPFSLSNPILAMPCGCGNGGMVSITEEEFHAAASTVAPNPLAEIGAERLRQIEAEGWTPEHDDEHTDGQLSLAAALYAIPYHHPAIQQADFIGLDMALELADGWKLKPEPDLRRRLVKAGALILAEIERLDRAAAKAVRP